MTMCIHKLIEINNELNKRRASNVLMALNFLLINCKMGSKRFNMMLELWGDKMEEWREKYEDKY